MQDSHSTGLAANDRTMTVHAPLTMTKEAFLAWIDRREERYEFAGGRVVMMVRVTWYHAVATSNLVVALKTRLDADKIWRRLRSVCG